MIGPLVLVVVMALVVPAGLWAAGLAVSAVLGELMSRGAGEDSGE